MAILTTMCKLFLGMALGFFAYKKNIFTDDTNKRISSFLVNMGVPCLVLNSVAEMPQDSPAVIFWLIVSGMIAFLLYFLIGFVFVRIVKTPKYLAGTYICMLAFSNSGFMCYPIVQSLFGNTAIFYLSVYNLAFNIYFFTVAVTLFQKDENAMNNSSAHVRTMPDLKSIINPGLVASIAALIIFFCRIPLPDLLNSCTGFIGGITTPMSMVIIGSTLAAESMSDIFRERSAFLMLPLRLVIIPLIIWFYLHLFGFNPELIAICTLAAGMPVATLVAMGSADHPRQNQAATIGVAVSTIFSLISIPVMIILLNRTL